MSKLRWLHWQLRKIRLDDLICMSETGGFSISFQSGFQYFDGANMVDGTCVIQLVTNRCQVNCPIIRAIACLVRPDS